MDGNIDLPTGKFQLFYKPPDVYVLPTPFPLPYAVLNPNLQS
jgi:hypothetical protein